MQNITATAQAHTYVRVLRRWWWLPVMFAVLSAGVTYAGTSYLIKPMFGSTMTLQVQPLTTTTSTTNVVDAYEAAGDMVSRTVLDLTWNTIQGCGAKFSCPSWLMTPVAIKGSKPKGTGTKALLPPEPLAASDYKSLWQRTTCTADTTTDRLATCTTTSQNYVIPSLVLNRLATVFISWIDNNIRNDYRPAVNKVDNQINSLQSQENKAQAKLAHVPSGSPQGLFYLSKINNLQNQLGLATGARTTLVTQITENTPSISITGPAVPTKVPVSPHPLRDALLGFVIGLAVAGALIVLLEYLDDHFHSADEIAEFTGLPLLGAVRKFEGEQDEMGTVAARMPRTAIAEAYRVARANIQFADKGGDLKVILVTSARDGEGKTTTANNLATTFALAGQRVLLVDADLRRPGLTRIMNLKDSDGVSSILVDPEADVISSTDIVGLSVVPSGAIPPNPAELLGSSGMRRWIERSLQDFDLIILDTPPVLSVADTRILAAVADGVLLVIDPGQTTRRMVRQARLAIENVGGRVLGIMLNRDVMRGEGYYYNYYYYYGQDRQGRRQRQESK